MSVWLLDGWDPDLTPSSLILHPRFQSLHHPSTSHSVDFSLSSNINNSLLVLLPRKRWKKFEKYFVVIAPGYYSLLVVDWTLISVTRINMNDFNPSFSQPINSKIILVLVRSTCFHCLTFNASNCQLLCYRIWKKYLK